MAEIFAVDGFKQQTVTRISKNIVLMALLQKPIKTDIRRKLPFSIMVQCICVATLRYDSNKTDLLYQEYQMLLQYVSWWALLGVWQR
jgi:hypothetical protein